MFPHAALLVGNCYIHYKLRNMFLKVLSNCRLLQIRNELNEQQNNKLRQQRDGLSTRRQQVIDMDKRIEELQARLNKKRALHSERQRSENETGRSNVAAVAPFIDGSRDNTFSQLDTKYQTLPRSIKLNTLDNRQLDKYILEVNCAGREGRNQNEAAPRQNQIPSGGNQNEAISHAQRLNPTSSGSFATEVTPQQQPQQGSNLRLFTARPFGSLSVNWPKTSTPIATAMASPPEKEIFITGAPAVSSAAGSTGKTYAPLTVMLPEGVTVQSAKTASPVYQMATSRLQPPSQPQLTQDAPSPSTPISVTSTKVASPPPWSTTSPVSTDDPLAQPPSPGQFAVTNSTKVAFSDRLKSKVPLPSTFDEPAKPDVTSTVNAGPSPAVSSQILPVSNPKSKLRALIESTRPVSDSDPAKKNMSVSSALSVLMTTPLSPPRGTVSKSLYRYAPKSVITNTYTKKLGSSALDKYRKNMSQLYRGFNVLAPGGGNTELPSPTTNTTKDVLPTSPDVSSGSSPVAKVSPVNNQLPKTADQPIGGERRPDTSPPITFSPSRTPLISSPQKASDAYHEEDVPLEGSPPRVSHMHRIFRRNSLIEATTSFSSLDPQPDEVTTSLQTTFTVARRRKGNLKTKDSVKSSRRVSFDPLALLLDASLEGELELVMITAKQASKPFTGVFIYMCY